HLAARELVLHRVGQDVGDLCGHAFLSLSPTRWPGLSRPSRSGRHGARLSGIAGTSPAMTSKKSPDCASLHPGYTATERPSDPDYGINKSGYVIHGAIHTARPEVRCVLHTHTRAGIAVSAMKCGLLPLSQTSVRFHGHIGYHDYEGPAVDLEERERLVRDLGP